MPSSKTTTPAANRVTIILDGSKKFEQDHVFVRTATFSVYSEKPLRIYKTVWRFYDREGKKLGQTSRRVATQSFPKGTFKITVYVRARRVGENQIESFHGEKTYRVR